ncbi:MAG: DUF362 domain-containing protein [Spirochaetia bacterium]
MSSFAIGSASLVWLLIRTGTKPSRAAYPCQRMAAANAAAWLGAAVVPLLVHRALAIWRGLTDRPRALMFALPAAAAIIFGGAALARTAAPADTSAAAGTQSIQLQLNDRIVGPPAFSDVFAVNGTDGADAGVARLIQLLENEGDGFYRRAARGAGGRFAGVVGSDDVVLIKINAQWDQRGGTNTDLVRSLVVAIADHPDGFTGEIVIADNGQDRFGARGGGGSMEWRDNNAADRSQSIADVVSELSGDLRVSAYLWDTITRTRVAEYSDGDYTDGYVVADAPSASTGIIVSYPKFTTAYGTRVSFTHGIWDSETGRYDHDRLVVVNVPVLKSHAIYGVTASVKHYMGVVSDKLTSHNAHRSVANGGMGTQMAETRLPDLNIIDAIWINARPGNGPGTNYAAATHTGIIAASRDPVALDVWAAETILIPTADALGYRGASAMDPRNDDGRRSFGRWLSLAADELTGAGYPVTLDSGEVNVRAVNLR